MKERGRERGREERMEEKSEGWRKKEKKERFYSHFECQEKLIMKSYRRVRVGCEVLLEWGDYSSTITPVIKEKVHANT